MLDAKTGKQNQHVYVPYLKDTFVMPFKQNIVHLFAFYNNLSGLKKALEGGCPYTKDAQGNTPLTYAIQRKSYDCSTTLVEFIM